jgi:DNA repair photolyase
MQGVQIVEQQAKSVINAVTGMPFKWSANPYRGCFHQCTFCYARRSHTYLEADGVKQWGTRLYVKANAPAVVRAELAKRTWKRESIAIGTVTDPYQPIEGRYRVTRGILEALRDYASPCTIMTRSPLVVRDIDVLQALARVASVSVSVSIATLDSQLARTIEPTVAPPRQRLRAVRMLADAGIEVNVALAPVLPQITDTPASLEAVVQAARDAGANRVWHNTLYLHDVTRDAFFGYLRESRPDLIAGYAHLYRGTFAPRAIAEAIDAKVDAALTRHPMRATPRICSEAAVQLSLIDVA